MTPEVVILISVLLIIFFWSITFFLLQNQIRERKNTDIILQQQTERERLINQIAQHIRQSLNLDEVLITTVADVKEFLQADRVLIYRIWGDGTGSAITEAVSPDYPTILGQTFPEEVFPTEYHPAYTQGKIRAITNIEQEDVESCLAEFVQQFGVQSKLVVPIIQENRDNYNQSSSQDHPHLWGLLITHQCSYTRPWQSWEIELMKQLANQVAIAIKQSELYQQLQELNAELENRVQQRTKELAHSNQTLQSLIIASPRAIFTTDLDNKIKIWNPAAEKMFGWQESEIINQYNPIISPENCLEYKEIKDSILKGITPPSLEISRRKKDGLAIDIVYSVAPLLDKEGKINGMVAVAADITEQRRQAEQVRLLQSVVINTNDAIVITEAETIDEPGPRIIYVNNAFTDVTGYSLEEVVGKTPRILQGPKTSRQELDKVRASLKKWQPITVEVINYRKDGSEFWVEFSLVPVADKKGYYTHWISVQRDITERKYTEQALLMSEARFRSLIENALDIITIIEHDGTIIDVSPSVEKILGYSVTELISQNFFSYVHPDYFVETCFKITNTIEDSEVAMPIEFEYRHQDGSWRTIEAISQKFIDNNSDNIDSRIVVNCRDITERKRLDEIRLALEKEKELSALKIRFFSMASHEFRTPLSTALAAAQLLETSQTTWENTEKRLRNLHRIQNAVKNMVQLLDDILTINRAETGRLEFSPQLFNLKEFCQKFIEEIQLGLGTQHLFNFQCEGDNITVNLDQKLLRSILSNLLSNAVKYSPLNSQIDVLIKFDSQQVLITIKDQGIGISAADQEKLFEPFHRGNNVQNIPGTGLGLIVTKKCVDLHKGTMILKSEVDLGTTVIISLPVG